MEACNSTIIDLVLKWEIIKRLITFPSAMAIDDIVDTFLIPERLLDVFVHIGRGYNHAEISQILGTSVNTVRNQMTELLKRLTLHTGNHAVILGYELGFLEHRNLSKKHQAVRLHPEVRASLMYLFEYKISDMLTGKEKEGLSYMLGGYTVKGTGNELGNSHHTVEKHRNRILRKMKVSTFTRVIVVGYELGWWQPFPRIYEPNLREQIDRFRVYQSLATS